MAKLTYHGHSTCTLETDDGTRLVIDPFFGDNPATDIQGANLYGGKWKSVLVRTGVFSSREGNDVMHPAHIVASDVGDAVEMILKEQGV